MFNKKLIRVLKNTINNLEEDLDRANFKIENRDNFIKRCKEENEQLKVKVADLENNIELLVNNSNDTKIKELVQTVIEN